jgi:hypothetical protein
VPHEERGEMDTETTHKLLTEVELEYAFTLAEAIAEVKVQAMADRSPRLTAALDVLVQEFDRMRTALLWYANPDNYDVDGAPGTDHEGLAWAILDRGEKARVALRKRDYLGLPMTVAAAQEFAAEAF